MRRILTEVSGKDLPGKRSVVCTVAQRYESTSVARVEEDVGSER